MNISRKVCTYPLIALLAWVSIQCSSKKEDANTGEQSKSRTGQTLAKQIANGKILYARADSCATCHGVDGKGVKGVFPPLDGSKWITSDKELLTKITLHGMMGEITVKSKKYNVPMPGFAFRMDNKDIADILTYVRNAWSNNCGDSYIEEEIDKTLEDTEKIQKGMYNAKDLLKAHPLK